MSEVQRLWLEPEEPGEVRLEAVLHLPAQQPIGAVAVCHPHPQYGGDMNNYVVESLCEAMDRAGMATLRFNFRGTGDSEGSFDGGRGELVDLQSAVRYLARIISMDSVAACGYSFGAMVANRAQRVRAIACVSPAGPLAPADVPVLVAIGSDDQFMPAEGLRRHAQESPNVTLEIFPGVDHFWGSGLEELSESVASFLRPVPVLDRQDVVLP